MIHTTPHQFSVIITTHNRLRLLVRCVESVLAQTYPANQVEIIVVDDGSRAQTARTAAAYCTDRPVDYTWQPQRGWGAARLGGVNRSQGEILAFLDDDCAAPPEWLAHYARAYTRWPQAGGIGGGLRPGPHLNVAGHKQYHGHLAYFNRLNAPLNTTVERAGRAWFTFGGNRTFRRDVWLSAQTHEQNDAWSWYFDDTRLDLILRQQDVTVYYDPAAWVYHHYHLSVEQRLRAAYRYGRSERFCLALADLVTTDQLGNTTLSWREKWRRLSTDYSAHSWLARGWYAFTQPLVWLARTWGQLAAQT